MQKLTPRQQEILAVAHLRANLSPREIAKETKLQERTVRYHLNRLLSLRVIQKAPFLNVYPLGLRYINVYFSQEPLSREETESAVATLKKCDSVAWLGELGGDYHYGLSILCQSEEDCLDVIHELSKSQPKLFHEKDVIIHRSLSVFPAKYLSKREHLSIALRYGSLETLSTTKRNTNFDALDHSILSCMATKHLTSVRSIAKELGKPHTSIGLRMKKLTELGVIGGEWFPIDSKRLGYQTLKVLVYCRRINKEIIERLYTYAKNHPNIVYFIECLGSWDFEIGLDLRTDESVGNVVGEIHREFHSVITTTKVVPMFRVLKWNLYPYERSRIRG